MITIRNDPSKAPTSLRVVGRPGTEPTAKRSENGTPDKILGVSVVTKGEAIGHGLWLDDTFLETLTLVGNKKTNGLKARLGHPGLSGDAISNSSSHVGRFTNLRRSPSGTQVFGDLEILESSKESPGGNLGDWVLSMAEEAPDLFATSIVFLRDLDAEEAFSRENSKGGLFSSPDKENVEDLPHARLADLQAIDVVDNPAANPDGFFSRGPENDLPEAADAVLRYATGVDPAPAPQTQYFGIHPDRAKVFFNQFLQRHDLQLLPNHWIRGELGERVSEDNPRERGEEKTSKREEGTMSELTLESAVLTAESLRERSPQLFESILESGRSEGVNGERDRVSEILEDLTGFDIGDKAKSFVESARTGIVRGFPAEEIRFDLKKKEFEAIKKAAGEGSPGPNEDPEAKISEAVEAKTKDKSYRFDTERADAKVEQIRKDNPDLSYRDALLMASSEMGGSD